MHSPFKISALFLTTAIALGVAGQAYALGVGDKGQFATIEQALKQENQVEVARAKYVLNPEDSARMKVLCLKFTINAAGDAYILMSDDMDDSKAKIQVVYGKLKNAHVYNPRNVGVLPQGVSPNSNLATFINRGAAVGDGVMLYGQVIKKSSDGSEQTVGSATVMANVSNIDNLERRNRVSILRASNDDVITPDKVFALELNYKGNQNSLAK